MTKKEIANTAIDKYSANQDRAELRELMRILPIGQKVVVEIGTEYGATFYCWSQIADKNALLVSIDWNVKPRSENWADRHNPQLKELKEMCQPGQTIELIKGKSQWSESYDKLLEILDGLKIDLLHIDGDHSYEGCKKDFEMYSPLVAEGGLIIFHDIKTYYKHFGAHQFWKELKGNKKEIYYAPLAHRGIGIYIKG